MYSYQSVSHDMIMWVINTTHDYKFNYVFINNQYYEFD